MKDFNLIEATDSYKVTHYRQYPTGTEKVYSFFESRGGAFRDITFFGLQYQLKRYLEGPVVTQDDIEEAALEFTLHFGDDTMFNRAGWEYIVQKYGGRLPVEICAVLEGTTVPEHNVMMTIVNTDPKVPWLTNYLETMLVQVWYPTTVCTQSRAMKQIFLGFLEKTGDPTLIDFKLHDFGFRGSTSLESAGIGGAAHLVNFLGTDTMQALRVARKYYNERMAGLSVAATEHSTMTAFGPDNEVEANAHQLRAYPKGVLSIVSDSYDIYNACREILGRQLKSMILSRDGVTVVRPDSGYPPEVVVRCLNILGEAFGYTVNTKGYKVLCPKVRLIQGDGIDMNMEIIILEAMTEAGWSADNLTMGSGGGLLQKVNRDTCKFAFKCSAVQVNGLWRDVMKDPITDPSKRSKAGRLALVRNNGTFRTIRQEQAEREGLQSELVPVFRNGELLVDQTFTVIRNRARVV